MGAPRTISDIKIAMLKTHSPIGVAAFTAKENKACKNKVVEQWIPMTEKHA
jgi:hypothetical protein